MDKLLSSSQVRDYIQQDTYSYIDFFNLVNRILAPSEEKKSSDLVFEPAVGMIWEELQRGTFGKQGSVFYVLHPNTNKMLTFIDEIPLLRKNTYLKLVRRSTAAHIHEYKKLYQESHGDYWKFRQGLQKLNHKYNGRVNLNTKVPASALPVLKRFIQIEKEILKQPIAEVLSQQKN